MNEWISVKDQLPIVGQLIVVVYKSDSMLSKTGTGQYVGEMNKDSNKYFKSISGAFLNINFISHWMPLPEPPEEK